MFASRRRAGALGSVPVRSRDMPQNRRRLASAAKVIAVGLVVAGCGGQSGIGEAIKAGGQTMSATPSEPAGASGTAATAATSATSTAAERGIAITTGTSEFGPMLFDRRGQAIYLFDKESRRQPMCYGSCAEEWPPVLTIGFPRDAGAVRQDLLGVTERVDGSTQVTYAGHPLYYYAHERPDQVLCHNVTEFGGRWLVVTPDGTPAA